MFLTRGAPPTATGTCRGDRSSSRPRGPRNPAGAACVQPVMTDYTDDELSLMHLDGIDCPDDDHARELYDALDQVDFLLWMIRGI